MWDSFFLDDDSFGETKNDVDNWLDQNELGKYKDLFQQKGRCKNGFPHFGKIDFFFSIY